MRVLVDPDAAEELHNARRWYSEHAGPIVSARFIAEFHRLRTIIGAEPKRGPEIEPGIRRILFRDRFPYGMIYTIREQNVVVIAVMHLHREPGYWRSRIGQR